MVIHICHLCNKEFNKKSTYDYHINNKKTPCIGKNVYMPTNINNIPSQNLTKYSQNLTNTSQNLTNTSQNLTNTLEEIKNENINSFLDEGPTEITDKNMCIYCSTIFTRNDNLQRHLNSYCKSKKYCDELEVLKEKFYLIVSENELLKEKLNNNFVGVNATNDTTNNIQDKNQINNGTINNKNQINNGTINNNNNNNLNIVQLVQFGNENMDDIDIKEAFNTYMSSTGGNIVSNVLKLTNFNKNYPENHNICMSDLSRELVKIYNGSKFITKKFKNVKGDILNKIVKNTHKIVNKLENDKNIKKSQDVQSKMKINKVSLKLIDGQSPEDIVREEVKEKNKLLMVNNKEVKINKNTKEIDYENSDTDSELDDDFNFNFEERQRIKYLEDKQNGLINIAHDRIKDELYNNRNMCQNSVIAQ